MLTITVGDWVEVTDFMGQTHEGTVDRIVPHIAHGHYVKHPDDHPTVTSVVVTPCCSTWIVDYRDTDGQLRWAYGHQIVKARRQSENVIPAEEQPWYGLPKTMPANPVEPPIRLFFGEDEEGES